MFDRKSLVTALFLVLPLAAQAAPSSQSAFPFNVVRDSAGKLTRIELPLRTSVMDADVDDLNELRSSLAEYQNSAMALDTAADPLVPQNDDDKKVYLQAKEYLKKDLSMASLNDNRLDKEYASAKKKLNIQLYRLLAAPYNPGAFDRETIVTEITKEVLGQASKVFGAVPLFDVFNFLVGQYVDALESRREFYQNQLLALIAQDQSMFTEAEKNEIRSSVYYSRVSIINIPARNKAKKGWADYGATKLAKDLKPCNDYVKTGDKAFGQCFKVVGTQIANRMVKKNVLSKSVSLAYDSKHPKSVRDFRRGIMLAELGLSLLPAPGVAKWPVKRWLKSLYVDQRKSEGYLYAHALMQSQTALAEAVLVNTANPIISK